MTHSFPPRRSSHLDIDGHRGAGQPQKRYPAAVSERLQPIAQAIRMARHLQHDVDALPTVTLADARGDVLGLCVYDEIGAHPPRSEEHTSELQSLMRISYAVFCLTKKKTKTH